jgi:hypothetical protein
MRFNFHSRSASKPKAEAVRTKPEQQLGAIPAHFEAGFAGAFRARAGWSYCRRHIVFEYTVLSRLQRNDPVKFLLTAFFTGLAMAVTGCRRWKPRGNNRADDIISTGDRIR